MLERWITALHTESAGLEEPAATRERLKNRFPPGATRRMTQLGLLVGSVLGPLAPAEDDTVVYASGYAETRALEAYLDSFPTPSPTLFQTSIHPSAVQQTLILRQQPIRKLFPVTGGPHLAAQALQVALLAPTPRTILCGGDERGTWLLQSDLASAQSFAFALALSASPANALARLTLFSDADAPDSAADSGSRLSALDSRLCLQDFFNLLHQRLPFNAPISPSHRLALEWL